MQTMPHGTGTSSPTAVHDPLAAPPLAEPNGQRPSSRLRWPVTAGAVVIALAGAVVGGRYVDHKVNSLADESVTIYSAIVSANAANQRGEYDQTIAKLEPLAKATLADNGVPVDTRATIVDSLLTAMVAKGSVADPVALMPLLVKTIDDRLPALASRQEQLGTWYLTTGDADLAAARFKKAVALYEQRSQRTDSADALKGLALVELTRDDAKLDKALGFYLNAAAADPKQTLPTIAAELGAIGTDTQLSRLARNYPLFRANADKERAALMARASA